MLHQTFSCEFRDLKEPIQSIPGCIPIHGSDLPSSLQDRSSESYKHFLLRSKGISPCDGVLVNSFVELESSAVRAMMEGSIINAGGTTNNPSVYMVGPIVENVCESESESTQNGSGCLAWLDEQQTQRSVLYVSFGSGGTLSQTQMSELALGLELSCQKFLWVVREPNDIASAIYFGGSSGQDPLSFLPKGFLERTKGKGFVVPYWAPQVQILSHKAIGGFLTQCGWFSTLEAVVNGLPIIAWPLFAEQRMVAAILADGLKVAIRPKVHSESGIVEKGEIAIVIKRVMVGDEGIGIRERMKVLQDAAASAVKVDGSSTTTLCQLVTKWINLGSLQGKSLVS